MVVIEMENGKRFVGVKFISAGDKIPQAGNVVSVKISDINTSKLSIGSAMA